jgi:hypothetical protein
MYPTCNKENGFLFMRQHHDAWRPHVVAEQQIAAHAGDLAISHPCLVHIAACSALSFLNLVESRRHGIESNKA